MLRHHDLVHSRTNRTKVCQSKVYHQVSYMEFHNKSTSLYVECRTEFLDNPSLDFDCVFNCMTHSVLDDDEDLLNIDQIG